MLWVLSASRRGSLSCPVIAQARSMPCEGGRQRCATRVCRILLFLRGIADDTSRSLHFRCAGPLIPSGWEMALMALVPDPFSIGTCAHTRARAEILARAARDRVSIKTRTEAFSSHQLSPRIETRWPTQGQAARLQPHRTKKG